jgi:hypothetical protein
MNQSTRVRSRSMLVLAAVALVPLAVTIGACGHGKPPETPASEEKESSSAEKAEKAEAPDGEAEPAASASAAAEKSEPASTESAAAAPSNPGSTKATAKSDPSWVACHSSFKPKGKSQAADVAALAKGCAKATKMKMIKAAASKAGDAQTWPLKAKANKCYRVYVQGAEGVKGFDAVIKDSTGAVAGQATGDGSTAVVLDDGAVCFKEADSATVAVSVKSGGGAYAVQIWGD